MKPRKAVPMTAEDKKAKRIAKKGLQPTVPKDAMAEKESPEEEASPNEEEDMRQGKYDMETLMAAHEIKNNPKKMEYAHKHMKKQMGVMNSIQDLKDYHDAKYGSGAKKAK